MDKRYDLVVHSVIMDITVCRRKLSLFLICFVVVVAVIIVVGCFFFSFFFCLGLFLSGSFQITRTFVVRVFHCANTSLTYYAQLRKFRVPFFECLWN